MFNIFDVELMLDGDALQFGSDFGILIRDFNVSNTNAVYFITWLIHIRSYDSNML